jgi:hypothetical protein
MWVQKYNQKSIVISSEGEQRAFGETRLPVIFPSTWRRNGKKSRSLNSRHLASFVFY